METALKLCRQQCKKMLKNDYRAYLDSVESNLLKNLMYLRKHDRSRSGNNDTPEISLLDSSGKPETIVPNAANFTPDLPESNISDLHYSIVIDDEEIVRMCLKKLIYKLSPGQDDIPAVCESLQLYF